MAQRTANDAYDELEALRKLLVEETDESVIRQLNEQIRTKSDEFCDLYDEEERAERRRAGALQYRRVLPRHLQ